MYAVIEVSGKQFKVAENDVIEVPLQITPAGDALELKNVLVLSKDGAVQVGTPHVDSASVAAKVLGEIKGKKVISFKMKRRKSTQCKNGHRQKYTRIQIEKING